MIEDATLTQLCVAPIDPTKIVSSDNGETAYSLQEVFFGSYPTTEEEKKALKSAPISDTTLGFVLDMEVDFAPYVYTTYTADKKENAKYIWGEHAPGNDKYQEVCRFKPGEKVLCIEYSGLDVVFPAVIVGHLDEDYIRDLYNQDNMFNIIYDSAEDAIADWPDWDWDSMIVRPLVRLRHPFGEDMGETTIINRVHIFPYKKYQI